MLKLIDLKRIDWNFYNDHLETIENDIVRAKSKKPGGDPYNTRISYLGGNYLKLAFSAYNTGRIDAFELASYVNTPVANLPRLEQSWGWKE